MSQPCSAPELVLFDAAGLQLPEAHPAILMATTRGLRVAAISNRPDVEALVAAAGHAELFDVWVSGTDGEWPFERALSLLPTDPQRVLFVSDDPAALRAAEESGLRTFDGPYAEIERVLD